MCGLIYASISNDVMKHGTVFWKVVVDVASTYPTYSRGEGAKDKNSRRHFVHGYISFAFLASSGSGIYKYVEVQKMCH